MTQASREQKPPMLPFYEKYGLKFYSSLVPQTIVLIVLVYYQSPSLGMALVSFYNAVGNFLPIKSRDQRQWDKIQNNNKYLLGPLIVSCLSTPVIIHLVWRNYSQIMPEENSSILSHILLLFTLGFLLSGSIDASHQLLHRTEPICKFFSYLNLFYLQFTIYPTEHLYLHHKKVGTLEDPITSPKNKTFYAYYFNALFSCYKFNYRYSKKIFAFNVFCTLIYDFVIIMLALREGSGWGKALFFILMSYFALFVMEAVEYIEHYGLVYRKDDKSQPVSEVCSWNTSQNQLLNWFIFKFQRHSDHHMNAYKIYPTLDLTQKMPQFPFDFVSGVVMATIPPLWFYLINPLADQVVERKPVSKEHRAYVNNAFNVLKIVLASLLPLRVIEYYLF